MKGKYRVIITLKSGIVHVNKFKAKTKEEGLKLGKALYLIDDCWKSNGTQDGYINFGQNYYRISDISHYSIKQVWF